MPENTIGKIILEAGSRAAAQSGGGTVPGQGLVGGDSSESAGRKVQKETRAWQGKMLSGMADQPRWWTRMFKTMGISVGLSGILKQSQIFTSTIGSIFQILGAFVDVILAPFVPLFIPAIRWLARKLPDVSKWAQGFAETLKRWGVRILKFFEDPWGNLKKAISSVWTTVKDTVKGWVDNIGYAIGDLIDAANIFGGAPKALQRPVAPDNPWDTEESGLDFLPSQTTMSNTVKAYLATAGARTLGSTLALGGRSTLPTQGASRPIGMAINIAEEAMALPNKAANKAIIEAAKLSTKVGVAAVETATGGAVTAPRWLQWGSEFDEAPLQNLAQGGWGAKGAAPLADDVARTSSRWGRLFNNPVTRKIADVGGTALSKTPLGGIFQVLETAEGIHDTSNIIRAGARGDVPWLEQTGTRWGIPQYGGAGYDAVVRGLGTAAVARSGGAGGVLSLATEYSTQTGYGQDGRYGDSDFVNALYNGVKDGMSIGWEHINGVE